IGAHTHASRISHTHNGRGGRSSTSTPRFRTYNSAPPAKYASATSAELYRGFTNPTRISDSRLSTERFDHSREGIRVAVTRSDEAPAAHRATRARGDRRDSGFMFTHIAAVIVACEVGFWIVLAAGLVCRYLLRLRVAGAVLLALIPLIDVVLLVAVAFDLDRGAEVGLIHSLAAVYLGVSIAFGPSIVRWADARFAYLFAGGDKPASPPKEGPEAFRRECASFGRWL